MTSYHDISYEQCASKSMTSIIRTTHNGQKEGPLIRISHLKTMQPNATNFARTSHNGKKPRYLVRKSRDKIRQQKPCDLIKKSHKGHKKAWNLIRKSHYGQEASLPFSAYSIIPPFSRTHSHPCLYIPTSPPNWDTRPNPRTTTAWVDVSSQLVVLNNT